MEETKNNILYIDDEIGNLTGFKASFSQYYNIHVADNVYMAQKLLGNNEIKVILIDYKMSEEDGISFAQRIEEKYPYVIKILVTAYTETEIAIKTVNSHSFYAFVSKPWDYEQLKLTIQNAIEKYELEKKNRELLIGLQESLENEKRANYAKDVFLKNISHEIRTPLNGILGFSDLIRESADCPKINKKLDLITRSCKRLIHTVQSIMDSAMIVSEKLRYSEGKFDLEQLILNVIQELRESYQNNRNVKIIADNLNNFDCKNDLSKVKVIVERIIDNTFKYSTIEKEIEVSIDSSFSDEFYLIKVENTGNKIDKNDYHNVFESFMSVNNSLNKPYEGIGLGLYIAKSYAEFLGGKIWIEDSEDYNIFCVTIKKDNSEKKHRNLVKRSRCILKKKNKKLQQN